MTLTGHSWFFLSWPLVAFKETHETMKTFVLKKIKNMTQLTTNL